MNKKRFWVELVEILFLFVLIYSLRIHATVLVENSGDSFVKWFQVKRLCHGLDYSRLDHHTMRWGINFLILLFQKIFGTQPSTYYLPSAFAATGASLLVYRIGILLRGRFLGILALLLFTLHPTILFAGGQLFPGIFSIFYVLASLYFLLEFCETEKTRFLILSSCFLFLAYGAKMTNLFFLPAVSGYLLWRRRTIKPVIIYLALLLCGFLLETLVIDSFLQDYTRLGRLALASGHFNFVESGLVGEKSLWGILTRWTMLPYYMYCHTAIGLFSSFYLLLKARAHEKAVLLALCFLSFAFFITFGLCDIDPVRYFLPHEQRYLNVTLPLTLLLTLYLACRIEGILPSILAFVVLALPFPIYLNNLAVSPLRNQFFKIDAYQKEVMSALQQGYGMLFFDEKNVRLYRAMFVDDALSTGIDRDRAANIFIMPPGRTPYNTTRYMYILTLQDDTVSQGIVRPYPHQYKLKFDDFIDSQQRLVLSNGEGILW